MVEAVRAVVFRILAVIASAMLVLLISYGLTELLVRLLEIFRRGD